MYCINAAPENQDWPKLAWDFPPCKSKDFYEWDAEDQLPHIRQTPAYRFAVLLGWIENDEWTGKCIRHWYSRHISENPKE
ncbi:hypothetical protein JCM31598_00790 [Desulfonatronum parangueonense]